MNSARILLVEDNPLTAKGLGYLLEREHYKVAAATSVAAAMASLNADKFDLVLLDISLPDGDGFAIARKIRQEVPELPIIFLTARDDEADVVRGFELGADDYITKPFRNRELLFRIRNALKRQHNINKELVVGALSLNIESGEMVVDNNMLSLTALEKRLMTCLMENAGHVVTRERLLDEIWDASGSVVNNNTLSVYLKRLRGKLGDPDLIETIKNIGYRLKISKD